MQMSIDHARKLHAAAAALVVSVVLCSCSPQTETAAPQPRPVRTVTIEQREAGTAITLTGRIEAEDEVALAFRISGRVLENDRKLGDRIEAGQVVARLESQNERNTLRAAQANLVASQGQLTQARNHFERQDTLLQARLDHARKSRPGKTGTANCGIAGRCRRSASENRV